MAKVKLWAVPGLTLNPSHFCEAACKPRQGVGRERIGNEDPVLVSRIRPSYTSPSRPRRPTLLRSQGAAAPILAAISWMAARSAEPMFSPLSLWAVATLSARLRTNCL